MNLPQRSWFSFLSKLSLKISAALFLLWVLVFLLCSHLDPWKNYLSIGEEFHISIWGRGWDSRIVVFNDAEYGPYRGSIISLVDANGNDLNPRVREVAFGMYAGIYYRYFEWIDGTLWTFMLSMWYPIIVFAIIPLGYILMYMLKKNSKRKSTHVA